MSVQKKYSNRDLWRLIDNTFRLMHPALHRHHQMVSYLSFHMAEAAEMTPFMQHLTMQAAYMHDIGAILEQRPLSIQDIEDAGYHAAQVSANLLGDFPGFAALAAIITHCQTPYRRTKHMHLPSLPIPGNLAALAKKHLQLPTPIASADIIHLADSVALMIDPEIPVLNQVRGIMDSVRAAEGDDYSPQAVAALAKLENVDKIWLDLAYAPEQMLAVAVEDTGVDLDMVTQIARLIALIIDFRSPFTAMHSAGVAASARMLAWYAGMDDEECRMMEVAGNLHDLGKIRTPKEILEKPGKLTEEEFNVIKEHAYFTDILLSRVRGFENLGKWAALHHEKINGNGYPYHLKGDRIPLGAKIMAVADIFSAITEDRPYRKGMLPEKVQAILRENAENGALSGELVDLLIRNYDAVNEVREKASQEAGRRYYRSMQAEKAGEGVMS